MEERKSLKNLLKTVTFRHLAGPDPADVLIDRIVSDSREVTRGSLFAALAGVKSDGHNFVESAIAQGCAAVIVENGSKSVVDFGVTDVCVLSVENTRDVLAEVVSSFYNNPGESLKFIGITGTNGKTTVSYLLEKVLLDRGLQVGVIGTVNYRYTDRDGATHQFPAPLTTPDPLILQRQLRRMVDEGVGVVIMEVSSHAIDQKRLGSIKFDVAAFTNLSHDHLDYHRSMDEYFNTKSLLFLQYLKNTGTAVLTFKETDDPLENRWVSALHTLLEEKGVSNVLCGKEKGSIVQPLSVEVEIGRTVLSILTLEGELSLVSPLVGRFNGDNIMTTLAIAATMGLEIRSAAKSLELVTGAPGRLERVELKKDEQQKTVIFVDYAHTPDALLNVLQALQAVPHEKLICVFGCGGDRDQTKRPVMGKIAAELSDVVVLTDDNPRTESATAILGHIAEGIAQAGMVERLQDWKIAGSTEKGCVVIPKRQEAIHWAVKSGSVNDIVLIAGKGHEKYQLTNQGKRFFDDWLEAREALFSWDIDSVTKALSVDPLGANEVRGLGSICTDSRKVEKGQIFVALQGDNFDGHDYLDQAVLSGAGCVVVTDTSQISQDTDLTVYKVADTMKALGDLAGYRRNLVAELSGPLVVGITGSCGKTTVKEMTAAIFEKRWPDVDSAPLGRVLRTSGNFNNLIGLPLSLLPIQLKHRGAVLEMGMNQPGEISRLTEIANPDISCIVNVHGAHLEGLGTIEGVAKAKEELFAGTSREGLLVVNLDDDYVASLAEKYPHKKITYTTSDSSSTSVDAPADLWSTNIQCLSEGKISFNLHIGNTSTRVNLRVPGRHNVANCLAAAAIAHAASTEMSVIVQGLEAFQSADKRLEIVRSRSGYSIINDTYNANAASMAAGLATLASMNGKKKIAILGDMLELGEASREAHRKVGGIAADSGLFFLAIYGDFAEEIAEGALLAGMKKEAVHVFSAKEDICRKVEKLESEGELDNDSWVLVKASRGMRFETIVDKLTARKD